MTSKLELRWPGKEAALAQSGVLGEAPSLIEQVESSKPRGDFTNRLIHGDNLAALAALSTGSLRQEIEAAGGVRLIYLDPPFATGDQFTMDVLIGDAETKLRLPAYGDTWAGGLAGYLSMLAPRLQLLHAILADDGSLYFHCDYRAAAHVRLLLDEIFGPDRLLNEIVWTYGLGNANAHRSFGRKHDTILLYTKSDEYVFNLQRGEITPAMEAKYRHTRPDGSRFMRSYGKEYDLKGGKPFGSVWEIPTLAATSHERVGYPTQKPAALLERIIEASSSPGDLVLDPFCGAGTTLVAANRLGRRWIGCDAAPLAIWNSRKRLINDAAFDLWKVEGADSATTLSLSYSLRPTFAIDNTECGPCVRLDGIEVEPDADSPRTQPKRGMGLAIEDDLLVRYVRSKDGETRRDVITQHWSDWLDGWAVGTSGSGGQPFTAHWEMMRTRQHRALPVLSAPLPHLASGTGTVTIRVTGFCGRSWMITWSLNGNNQHSMEGNYDGSRLADPRR